MRRTTRKGDLKLDSHSVLESGRREMKEGLMTCEDEFVSSSWMPRFKFVQSSHYAAETSVNGETELVHWIVKDRPFSIRIVEVPTAVSVNFEEPTEETSDFLWSDVEVRAEVVYKTSKSLVKTSTGQPPLAVESSVVPPHAYNHRRNAAHLANFDSDTASTTTHNHTTSQHHTTLKLKEGAGLELNSRLSILSSHLRNDFCIHVQLFMQGQRVASWFSPAIKTVSKWDKVRLLQESSYLPAASYASTRTKTAPRHSQTSNSHTPSVPSSSRLDSENSRSAAIPTSTSTRVNRSAPAPMVSRSSRRLQQQQTTQMPVSSTMPKVLNDDCDSQPPSSQEVSSEASVAVSAPVQHHEPRLNTKSTSASSSLASRKKKGSGEEVFDMLAQLRRVATDLSSLASNAQQNASKKRKAHWEASADAFYPSEAEAAHLASVQLLNRSASSSASFVSSARSSIKKSKLREVSSSTITHNLSCTTTPIVDPKGPASAQFEVYARQFLHMLEMMPLGEVREALKTLLLSRPDLSSSLALLMNPNTNKAETVVYSTEAPSCSGSEGMLADLTVDSKSIGTSCGSALVDVSAACHHCAAAPAHQQHISVPVLPQIHHPQEQSHPADSSSKLDWNIEPSLSSSFGIPSSHVLGQSTQFWPTNDRYGIEVFGDGSSNIVSEGQVMQNPHLVFSPSAGTYDDESTTMGSPNSYSSWTESDWNADPHSFSAADETSDSRFDDFLPHSFFPVLTASSSNAGSQVMHVGI